MKQEKTVGLGVVRGQRPCLGFSPATQNNATLVPPALGLLHPSKKDLIAVRNKEAVGSPPCFPTPAGDLLIYRLFWYLCLRLSPAILGLMHDTSMVDYHQGHDKILLLKHANSKLTTQGTPSATPRTQPPSPRCFLPSSSVLHKFCFERNSC